MLRAPTPNADRERLALRCERGGRFRHTKSNLRGVARKTVVRFPAKVDFHRRKERGPLHPTSFHDNNELVR